jgi:N-carbamoylputrescine amidase
MMMRQSIRIAMLHAALRYDNVLHNIELLERLLLRSLELGPDIVVMPELAVSGYKFFKAIGSEWIKEVIPKTIDRFSGLARENNVAIILGCPRYREETDEYYNAAILIDERGKVAGEHYKINVLPGSEAWSSPGFDIKPTVWNGYKIGLLICSDAHTENIAAELARQGADVLISPAAWAPGFHGPDGEWEQRSKETGLCLYVCNRTGVEKNMTYTGSSSVVVAGGRRVIDYSNDQPAILSVDVRPSDWLPLSQRFKVLEVNEDGAA